VPLQVQLLESELRPHLYNSLARNGNRIRAGIEFDAIGRRTAYYFYRSRPGDLLDVNTSEMVRVSSPEIIHLFDPVRPGQLCGLPVLTRALISLHELDKFDDATLLRQQLQTMFVGFLKREPSLADPALDPMTGLEPQTDDAGRAMVAMEPGTFQELHPGEDVTFSEPPEAGSTYEAFMRQQLRRIAAGVFTPYELITGDMSALNDRTVRVILHDFRRKLQQWQHQIVGYQLCRRIWLAFLEAAVQDGALPVAAAAFLKERDSYAAVKWMPQGWPYIHPVQDVEAAQASVRNGFKTRSDVVNELGEDVELVDQGQAADNERADELGLQYDSDGRKDVKAKTGTQPTAQPGEVVA
jgi:lambda family phage portal protein